MALIRNINTKAASDENTGLSTKSSDYAGRFFNKDGQPNVEIKGTNFLSRFSIYQIMLEVPLWKFLVFIISAYLLVNLFFASVYLLVGIEHLGGVDSRSIDRGFWEAFFFSAQTLSTVGYGHIYPSGILANSVAAIESLMGLLMFAIATGLMYGRFSKPKAYLKFSKNALMAPYQNKVALMFRFAPYKKHFLSETEVSVSVAIKVSEGGVMRNRFYTLPLELSKTNTLALNWTVVHPIDEKSPLYNLSKEDIIESKAEILVFVKGYDEEYASTVITRTSYTIREIIFGARFVMMYQPNESATLTILDLNKLNEFEPADLPNYQAHEIAKD